MATAEQSKKPDSSTSARAASAAHDAVDRAAETAEHAEEQAREVAAQAGRLTEEAIGSVQAFIRERPMAALGIAFVVGALASSWMRR